MQLSHQSWCYWAPTFNILSAPTFNILSSNCPIRNNIKGNLQLLFSIYPSSDNVTQNLLFTVHHLTIPSVIMSQRTYCSLFTIYPISDNVTQNLLFTVHHLTIPSVIMSQRTYCSPSNYPISQNVTENLLFTFHHLTIPSVIMSQSTYCSLFTIYLSHQWLCGGRNSSLVVYGLAVHSVTGPILLWGNFPVEGIFPLELTWVRTLFPPKLFRMRV